MFFGMILSLKNMKGLEIFEMNDKRKAGAIKFTDDLIQLIILR